MVEEFGQHRAGSGVRACNAYLLVRKHETAILSVHTNVVLCLGGRVEYHFNVVVTKI